MNKTLVGLVLIALLIGLGGGYVLGYVIYQPQLQNIQNDLDDLGDRVNELDSAVDLITSMKWHEVYSLSSTSDSRSEIIHFNGSRVRAMWIATSDYLDSWLSIVLEFSNGTEYAVWGSSGLWTANNAVLELPSGVLDYYVSVKTYQTNYTVSLWVYW